MAASEPYSEEYFKTHGKAVRCYDIQERYEELTSTARRKGVSRDEMLKERNFKDINAFYLSCPKFSMFCWPSKFATLGGGAVLYFHFLAFCGCFLFLAFLVQLPAVLEYTAAGKIAAWNYDPGGFDTTDISNCECSGGNGDFTGPNGFSQTDYGTRCEAWDLGWCQQGAAGPYAGASLGKWCCRKWCYASASCPNTQDNSPSLSNRLNEVNGLVRSYYACNQPDPVECTGGSMDADIAYPLDVYQEDTRVLSSWMKDTGPGNLGPDQGDNATIPLCYVALTAVFCLAVGVKSVYQVRVKDQADQRIIMPSDFAVLVEGLPVTATDETAIAEFFKEHAVEGKSDTEIVKVIIGYNSPAYRENMRKLRALKMRLLSAVFASNLPSCISRCYSFDTVEDLVPEMAKVQKAIQDTAPSAGKRISSSGTVVVVFRKMEDHNKCLKRWKRGALAKYCSCLCKGDELPNFFWTMPRVKPAPNPRDMNWEDLGVAYRDKMKRFLKSNALMALIILVCFVVCYAMRLLKGVFMLLPAVGVAVANACLTQAAKHYGAEEYYNTITEQQASISLKMATAMIMNTSGVIFFTFAQPKEWYIDKGLVGGMFSLLSITAVIQPLLFLWDAKYTMNGFLKRKNVAESCQDWNEQLARLNACTPKTKAEAIDVARGKMQVQKMVQKMEVAFEPTEIDMTKRYAYAVRTVVCCLLFCPLMPIISLLGIIGLAVQYWVDKYMLLRWARRPVEPYPGQHAVASLIFVRYVGAIFLPIAAFVFLMPSWKNVSELIMWLAISLCMAILYLLIPPSCANSIFGCLVCCCGAGNKPTKVGCEGAGDCEDYYNAQLLWPKDMKYHKSQFLYAMLPESKNPEMLAPDSKAHSMDGLSAAFAAGGAAAAASKKAAVDDEGDDAVVAAADVVVADVVDAEPDAADAEAPPPKPAAPAAVWEFEIKDGWAKYSADCHDHIECRYQEKLKGGRGRINVVTNGYTISVDFDRMTQKMGRRIRAIRRREE